MTEPNAIAGRTRGKTPVASEGWRFIIPVDDDLNVNVGEMVVAGLTVIARKRENEAEDKTENGDQNHAED